MSRRHHAAQVPSPMEGDPADMPPRTHYNLLAGRSVERLTALSDGIFAVAMTLLVLDLHVPTDVPVASTPLLWAGGLAHERLLWNALIPLAPRVVAYLMSFLTLGIFWLGQQTQLSFTARSDRALAWIYLSFLLAVTLMPFSTALLAGHMTYRLALVVYWCIWLRWARRSCLPGDTPAVRDC
jgi:uncharacterized membrane protein